MIADILHPTFYESKDAEDLAHELKKAGLFNLGQLIKELYTKVDALYVELEDAKQNCYEEGFQAGSDAAYESYCEDQDNKADQFSTWFLREFEPESKKCMKQKEIGGRTFIIIPEDNYNDLKAQFHSMCD